jgi:hypothetical protein
MHLARQPRLGAFVNQIKRYSVAAATFRQDLAGNSTRHECPVIWQARADRIAHRHSGRVAPAESDDHGWRSTGSNRSCRPTLPAGHIPQAFDGVVFRNELAIVTDDTNRECDHEQTDSERARAN